MAAFFNQFFKGKNIAFYRYIEKYIFSFSDLEEGYLITGSVKVPCLVWKILHHKIA
jgi:hypothetical protein